MARAPARPDRRSPEATAYRRLYKTARWRKLRLAQLSQEPLCRMCAEDGRTTLATVCDHVDPRTKDDPATFYDGPFQSLCDEAPWRCHSSRKQRIEALGYEPGCKEDGRPRDPAHPWNRRA